MSAAVPPGFLRSIPNRLLDRRRLTKVENDARALALLAFCEQAGHRPTFADLYAEAHRRGIGWSMAQATERYHAQRVRYAQERRERLAREEADRAA